LNIRSQDAADFMKDERDGELWSLVPMSLKGWRLTGKRLCRTAYAIHELAAQVAWAEPERSLSSQEGPGVVPVGASL
jgi:hypothetical protein